MNCPVCGSYNIKFLTDELRFGKKGNLFNCEDCELIFIDQSSNALKDEFFESEYHENYFNKIDGDVEKIEKFYNKMQKNNKFWVDLILPHINKADILFEVGCSSGYNLSALKNYVKSCDGVELNEKERKFCCEKLKLNVKKKIEDFGKDYKADVILLNLVFQYFSKPVEYLKYIKSFLSKNGRIIISVQNVNDPLLKFYDLPEFRKFYFAYENIYYFSKKSLKIIFENAGLLSNIKFVQEYPLTNHLNWIFTSKPADSEQSRMITPPLSKVNMKYLDEYNDLFFKINHLAKEFYIKNGFSDKIFCVLKLNNDIS